MENKNYKTKKRSKPEGIEFQLPLQKKCEHDFCIYKGNETYKINKSYWKCTEIHECGYCGKTQKTSQNGF